MSASRLILGGTFLAVVLASSSGFAQTYSSGSADSESSRYQTQSPERRLTYEEAWKLCTPIARQEAGDSSQRYLRAASCMKRLGHNI
jgi:hypothetical protein